MRHSSRSRRDRVEHDLRLLDRVDGAAVAPVRLAQLGVAGAALDRDRRVDRAAAGDPDLERRRLGHDARVGAHAVGDRCDAARARRLLVGDRVHEQVACEADVEPGEHLGREHHRRDAALHVAGAAAVELAVAHDGRVRVVRPARLGLAGDDVDVAVEQQAAPAARAGEARDAAAAGRRSRGWNGTCGPRTSSGLGSQTSTAAPAADRRSARSACSAASSRAGSPGIARGRVEADQCGGELDELVTALGDRLGDALLEVVHRMHSSAACRAQLDSVALLDSTRNAAPLPCGSLQRLEPQPLGVVARELRDRGLGAVGQQPLGLRDVERRAQALVLAGRAQRAEVDVDRDVLRARRRRADRRRPRRRGRCAGAERGARSARRPPRRSRGRSARPRASARASDALQLGLRRRDVVLGAVPRRHAGGAQGIAEATGRRARDEAEAAVRADLDEQLGGPAQAVGGAGVVHLVGDDRARARRRAAASSATRAPRHARPGLREHARRALAEHEVEREIAELGGEAGGERAVARARSRRA